MKSVVITQAVEVGGKRYYAGAAIVSDDEATALAAVSALTGGATTYLFPTTELPQLLENIPQPNVPALGATTAITTVPGSFADLAAVQTYLAAAMPIIETRLDDAEDALDTALGQLETAGIFEAE